jgi:CBS domain-containing protein
MMRVEDLMTEPVHTVSASTSGEDAWTSMRTKGIHHLVVLEGGRAAGIISSTDLGGRRGAATRASHTVAELMTAPVISVEPSVTVRRAANMMRGRSIGCLLVTRGKRVVGIVTTADLLELVGRGVDPEVGHTKRWTLKHRAPHRARHSATGVW